MTSLEISLMVRDNVVLETKELRENGELGLPKRNKTPNLQHLQIKYTYLQDGRSIYLDKRD